MDKRSDSSHRARAGGGSDLGLPSNRTGPGSDSERGGPEGAPAQLLRLWLPLAALILGALLLASSELPPSLIYLAHFLFSDNNNNNNNNDRHFVASTVREAVFGHFGDTNLSNSPSQAAQLVRASSQYTKVWGSIPGQDTYEKQPENT